MRLKQAEDSYAKIKVLEGLLAAAATKIALEEFQAVQAANATLEAVR